MVLKNFLSENIRLEDFDLSSPMTLNIAFCPRHNVLSCEVCSPFPFSFGSGVNCKIGILPAAKMIKVFTWSLNADLQDERKMVLLNQLPMKWSLKNIVSPALKKSSRLPCDSLTLMPE